MLGIGAKALCVAHLLVEREVVNRHIVNLALDILCCHGIEELVACAGELIELQLNDIQVPCSIGLRDLFLYKEIRNVGKAFFLGQ